MKEIDDSKKNWLEYGYEFLLEFHGIYKKGYLSESEYEKYKLTVLRNEQWKEVFSCLPKDEFLEYNKNALIALNNLYLAGGITQEEYAKETKKIVL